MADTSKIRVVTFRPSARLLSFMLPGSPDSSREMVLATVNLNE